MWRISDEPIISLDGDTAGIRAALRVIDLALPLLEAGKGLRFAVLPGGMDPDDLIRAQGAGAMQAVLDGAQPMVKLLWSRAIEGKVFDSPERKAALDKSLREQLKRIADPSIRSHYGEEVKQLRWELFGQRPRAPRAAGAAFLALARWMASSKAACWPGWMRMSASSRIMVLGWGWEVRPRRGGRPESYRRPSPPS